MSNRSLTTTQAQSVQTLLERYTSAQSQAQELRDMIDTWDEIPAGHGKHGRYLRSEEGDDISLMWIDEELYVFNELETRLLNDREGTSEEFTNLVEAADHQTVRDRLGTAQRRLLRPIICVDRQNPADPRQNLMVVLGYTEYRIAQRLKHRGWNELETIVHPDMPDYDIRGVTLQYKAREAGISAFEAIRNIILLESDYDYEHSTDSPEPLSKRKVNESEIARTIGCSPSMVHKVNAFIYSKMLTSKVREGKLQLRVAYAAAKLLGKDKEKMERAVTRIIEQNLSATDGERYLQEVARPPYIQLEAPKATDKGEPMDLLYRALKATQEILDAHSGTIADKLGQDKYGTLSLDIENHLASIQQYVS